MTSQRPGIDLLWIPLGAGGSGVVRFNGRVYERIKSLRERRPPLDLFHTALRVGVPEGDFVVETMWPSPRGEPDSRGVVMTGPVFARSLAGIRLLRYEVRRWRNGQLADGDQAVGGAQLVSSDREQARSLLGMVAAVPPLVWGRDERHTGEMWNSNSVISWLLTRVGLDIDRIRPPGQGRAPGWDAGVAIARQTTT
jgi:hypothetical protein